MKKILNAKASVPVTNHEMAIVSSVPIALQLMDFTILRIGFSAEAEVFSLEVFFDCFKTSESIIISELFIPIGLLGLIGKCKIINLG